MAHEISALYIRVRFDVQDRFSGRESISGSASAPWVTTLNALIVRAVITATQGWNLIELERNSNMVLGLLLYQPSFCARI